MKTVYKGKLLKVLVKKVRLPHGYVATYEMVRHPGAALIVPFAAPGKIIMLRQLRPVIGKYIYELPAGTLDKGENPLSCAKREIVEETGYKARRFRLLGFVYPVSGYSTEKIFIYRADGLEEARRLPEKDEVIESRAMSKGEVVKLFKSGRIVDAKTIAALAFCGWL
ncbi:MAG: NUDIX hydrolase [Candidatus Omnitrophota bacterium]